MTLIQRIKFYSLIILSIVTVAQLNGCATITSLAEGAAESMRPTVMSSLDSFESAAMAIRLSNRVLKDIPIKEEDEWPFKLQGTTSGAGMAKMGLSLAGTALGGVTLPTEMDPETGFPRPTSAFYIFLKEREKMLDQLQSKDDMAFFKKQPKSVIHREKRNDKDKVTDAVAKDEGGNKEVKKKAVKNKIAKNKRDKKIVVAANETTKNETIATEPARNEVDKNESPIVYRNTLMAYGVVTANKQEIMEIQQEVENTEKGFKTCNLFLHKSTEEIKDEKIIKKSCPDPGMKDEDLEKKLATKLEKQDEKANAEKQYGKLAGKVYKASVAGADFTAAAVTKIGFAIVNGVRALPNIKEEFSGLKGAYNISMILPRAKNIFKSLGIYKDNLNFQWTVYKTMYQQIKGTYEIKDDEPTKQALQRIKAVELAMAELEPKLNLALAGAPVQFTDTEAGHLNMLAAMFPTGHELEKTFVAALKE